MTFELPMRRYAGAIVAMAILTAVSTPTIAKDLGVHGATWAIAEPDLLVEIETRLSAMQRSGEMARIEAEARARARARLEQPEPVLGIAPAREAQTRLFDPAVTVARDIRLPDGTLIAAAGARVNPLDRHPLSRDLLFVDGRREVEIVWALEHPGQAKIVLLAGRPLDLARRHGRPFFFDQDGRLAARFGLAATPSLVEQAGSKLRITEIPIKSPPSRLGGRDSLPGSRDRDPMNAQQDD